MARDKGVGIIARAPLASGWLTGKYDENTEFPQNDHRSRRFPPDAVRDLASRLTKLDFLLDEAGSMAEAALRFVLSQPAVSAVIPGAKSPEQIAENAKAAGKTLSDGVLTKIKAALT